MSKFTPTSAELALVSQIFNKADPQKLGILTGDVAVKVFGGADLQPTVLGEIWSIADEDNNGWLPRKGVAIALRLIAWAQKGEKITPDLVFKPGPLPDIEGYSVVSQHATGTPLAKSPPPTLPPFTPQEKAKFLNLFNKAGPDANGLLSSAKARDIFVKSKLSNDTLLQIWNLADTQDRGALDSTDFAIGMYFIQALMSGQLTFVPTSLPPGLYQQAGGSSGSHQGSVRSHMTGNSGSLSPLNSAFPQSRTGLQPQYTGQSQLLQPNHTGYSVTPSKPPALPARPAPTGAPPPFVPQRNGHAPRWDVTADEKATADTYFDDLDPQRRGYIEGDVAVPFLLKSNLPGEDLARVWDLADINNDGKLTRDGFAVAMHLIQMKLAGTDIPSSLPPTLVPPSLRGSTAMASPFQSPPPQQQAPQEPARDLLWDDTPPASATVPLPTRAPEPPKPQQRSVSVPILADKDPFDSSAFSSTFTSNHDLLGDDDETPPHVSPPLQDHSAEIGNTQNQLNSTNRALDTLKNERAQSDERLANQTSQLDDLQAQLSTAKAAYETETKTLATIRERYTAQNADLQKVTEELIRAESELSAIRVEKSEVQGAYMRDKEDTRELQRKMAEVGQLIEATKAEVEKAKKDAKQQKGLLAIAKKQLSAKEIERAKAEKELEEAAAEVAAITKERNDTESEVAAFASAPVPTRADSATFAANHVLPASPESGSPAPSTATGKSNNPFDKLNKSGGTPRSQSPFLPFAAGSLPTPSVDSASNANSANRQSSYDPFGFSEAFETDASTNEAAPPQDPEQDISRTSTPKPTTLDASAADTRSSMFSPGTEGESDHFVTPPTTATTQRSLTSSPAPVPDADAAIKFPALDDTNTKFPDIETQGSTTATRVDEQAETDLSSKLQELDVEESDSDSEDEVPLADLAAKAKTSPSPKLPFEVVPVLPTAAEAISFDDVFGVTPPSAAKPQFGATAVTGSPTVTETEPTSVAGVNAFDEAMGTIPPSATPSNQAFTFDDAFDDNFDFDSANKPFPPPPTSANVPNGSGSQGLDSIIAAPAKDKRPVFAPPPGPPPSTAMTNGRASGGPPSAPASKPTFDEAFAGFETGPSLNLDSTFAAPASKPPASPPFPPTTRETASPPASARPKSPPPRTSSPKPPRSSNASSKETHEKIKEPSTRHSKLSIRLPFGKKKKQQAEPLPVSPAQHLTPPREEPSRTATPAVDDDVEAVKQLSAMGFSRSQAVEALEKYGYDVPRALNSLLGAP